MTKIYSYFFIWIHYKIKVFKFDIDYGKPIYESIILPILNSVICIYYLLIRKKYDMM